MSSFKLIRRYTFILSLFYNYCSQNNDNKLHRRISQKLIIHVT